jgi:hypothetical protein
LLDGLWFFSRAFLATCLHFSFWFFRLSKPDMARGLCRF